MDGREELELGKLLVEERAEERSHTPLNSNN